MAGKDQPFTLSFPDPLPVAYDGTHWWLEGGDHDVRLTNLDKIFWPRDGYTKGDLLTYYWNVAHHILRYVEGRPLTLKRLPDGIDGGHFYQRDAPDHTPDWLPRCAIEPEDGEVDEMLMAEDPYQLLFIANLGAIELHPVHSHCERYDRPDYLVFDLDPFPPAGFQATLDVARHVAVALDGLGLAGYPKTSGATGIQVYVPVAPHHSFDETRALAERLGKLIRKADPDLVTMEWAVEARHGHVFIDHNMNRRGASLAAAYSVRPRDGAPVSAPLDWEEVEQRQVSPDLFRMDSILDRLENQGDLFAPVEGPGQDLDDTLEAMQIEVARMPEENRLRRRISPCS